MLAGSLRQRTQGTGRLEERNVACNRLITGQAQQISPATVPDDAMVNLVRRLMFRAITQAKEHPPIPVDDNPRKADRSREACARVFLLRCEWNCSLRPNPAVHG